MDDLLSIHRREKELANGKLRQSHFWREAHSLTFAGFLLLLGAGCSKGPYSAEVSGTVTLDDKPVPTGQVMFHPTAGGPMAYGAIDADGNYTIRTAGSEGLIPGDYTATVVSFTKEPWEGITAEQVEQIRLVPRSYADAATSDQQFKIASGANQCDLRLQSR